MAHRKRLTDIDRLTADQRGPAPRRRGPLALEPRVLLDAAALETGGEVLDAAASDAAVFAGGDGDDPLLASLDAALAPGESRREVVFIDGAVDDREALLQEIGTDVPVYILDSSRDGLTQITETLAAFDDLDAVHLISHGGEGSLRLGNATLDGGALDGRADALQSIGGALSTQGDLLLYGCDVAAGDGAAFIGRLAQLTGADVAASDDLSGNLAQGGDWQLERHSGTVEARALFAGTVEGFRQALATGWVNVGDIATQDAASAQQGNSVAAGDNWVAVAGNTDKVHLFDVTGSNRHGDQEHVITLPNGAEGAGEGGVALDVSGDYLIAGDSNNGGWAYIYHFDRNVGNWQLQQTLQPVSGVNFGWDVAIDTTGSTYYAAATALDDGDSNEGQVVAWYSTDGTNWWGAGSVSQTPGDGDDQFGYAIDIAGGKLYAGAPDYDDDFGGFWGNPDLDKGRLYSFNFSGTSLQSSPGYIYTGGSDTGVGRAVDADFDGTNTWLAVGSLYGDGSNGQDRVWVFRDNSLVNTIDGNGDLGIGAGDQFGYSVAMDGSRLIVGAPFGHGGDGWAFRFEDATVDTISQQYGPYGDGANAGYSVGAGRDIVVIGRPLHDRDASNTDTGRGTVWFYNRAPDGSLFRSTGENTDLSVNIPAARYWGNLLEADPVSLISASVANPGGGGGGELFLDGSGGLTWSPGSDYDYLASGESTTVEVSFVVQDSAGEQRTNILSVTVNGADDAIYTANPVPGQVDNVGTTTTLTTPFLEPDVSEQSGVSYTATAVAMDSGAPALSVSVNQTTGEISYTPALEHYGFRYRIDLSATSNSITATDSFFTDIERSNVAPTVTSSPGTITAYEDGGQPGDFPYDMTLHFDDGDLGRPAPKDGETLTYTIESGQSWLSVNPTTGELTSTALNQHVGSHSVTVRVTDQFGLWTETGFTVNVLNTNDAPIVVAPVPDQEAYMDQSYSFVFNVADYFDDIDPTNDTITLTAEFIDGTGRILSTAEPDNPDTPGADAGDGQWLRFRSLGGGDYEFYSDTTVQGDSLGTQLQIRLVADDGNAADNITNEDFTIDVFPSPGSGSFIAAPANNTESGWDVAISENGQWMAVGQPRWTDDYQGNVRIFEWTGSAWASRSFVYVDTNDTDGGAQPRTAGDRFGYSVDLNYDGSRLLVGAPGDDGNWGRVYGFTNDGTGTFSQTINYIASDSAAGDNFGSSVALNRDGSQFIVGAWGDDNVRGTDAGAAYLYNWGNGTYQDKLLNTLDSGESNGNYDRFGFSVDFDRSVAIIGAPLDSHDGAFFAGSATVVDVEPASFGPSVKLDKGANSRSQDFFGWSVGLDVFQGAGTGSVNSSAVFAVGAIQDDALLRNHGAVHTYRSDSLSFTPTQAQLDTIAPMTTVTAYDGEKDQSFGISVAVDAGGAGDIESTGHLRMVVGGDVNGLAEGAAYAYRWWGADGWLGKKYEQVNGTFNTTPAENQFGWSVGISGTRLVVGAPNTNEGAAEPRGAVYWGDTAGTEVEQGLNSGSVAKSLGSGDTAVSSDSTSDVLAFRSPLELQEDEEERIWRLRDEDTPEAGTFNTGLDADALFESPRDERAGDTAPAPAEASIAEQLLFEERTREDLAGDDPAEKKPARDAREDSATDKSAADKGDEAESKPVGFRYQLERENLARNATGDRLMDALEALAG